MRQPALITWASSLLESLLPKDIGEVVVGDLAEETLLQARTKSRDRVGWWFVWQVIGSIPGLLLLSLRRLSWFKSLGVAVVAYLALRLVEPRVHLVISKLVAPPFQVQLFIDLAVGSLVCVCAGYLATWLRRGSAVPLAAIGTITVCLMVFRIGGEAPLWYQAAFLVIAPLAPIAGGVCFVLRENRRIGRHN